MNVTTNRRKSTDTAESQQQSQQQQHSHQQPVIAYVSCRQASSSAVVTSSSSNSSHTPIEEQDQLVSSTSNECLLMPTEGEGEEINLQLDSLITSPARISSSTVGYEVQTNAQSYITDEVMPSTSETAVNIFTTRSVTESDATVKVLHNSIATNSTSGKVLKYNEIMVRNMTTTSIAEGCETNAKGCDMQTTSSFNKSSSESASENQKIILKLSKTSSASMAIESCLKSADHKTSDTEDLRKVEPLKINLLGTHVHSPKITIKPILKTQAYVTGSSEECSSSAEDEVDLRRNTNSHEPHILPKLTIRAVNEECGTSVTTVVPKLTIKMNDSTAESFANSTNNFDGESGTCEGSIIENAHLIENSNTQQASVTLPLPKLTIKTGSDGQSESIMMNVSPASSTSSSSISHCFSSSSSFSSFSSNSSANCLITASCGLSSPSTMTQAVPKLTIKPLPRTEKDTANLVRDGNNTLPKYTIKNSNLSNAETASGGEILEGNQTTTKLPKLTIKTGQEHAVIITQHNDNVGSPGIPKLTIKTKSLEGAAESLSSVADETADHNEKIPKLTIKTATTNINDTPLAIPKLTINVSQLESSGGNGVVGSCSSSGSYHTPSLKQTVPKLTITRQQSDKVITNHNQLTSNLEMTTKEELEGTMPKMTIKAQKKLLSIVQPSMPVSFERSDRPQMQDKEGINEATNKGRQTNIISPKVVPKLTIKNVGSPKFKMMVVRDVVGNEQRHEETNVNRAMSVTCTSHEVHSRKELEDFNNLMHVANGGESNSSQEFCGFSDVQLNNALLLNNDVPKVLEKVRRNSDDMDIDEALQQQHDPQIFNNLAHFTEPSLSIANGSSCLVPPTTDIPSAMSAHMIDTVDLTSSPSPSNSPNNFNYLEEVCHATDATLNRIPQSEITTSGAQPTSNILLECLQRDSLAPTCPYRTITYNHHTQQQPQILSPPAQPISLNTLSVSSKYPQLAERLLANGIINNTLEQMNFKFKSGYASNNNTFINHITEIEDSTNKMKANEKIIDSIEIFDSPEGSPRQTSFDEQLKELKYKSGNMLLQLPTLPNGLHYNHHLFSNHSPGLGMVEYNVKNNNNNNPVITSDYLNKSNLKRTTPTSTINNPAEVNHLGMSPPKMHCMGNENNSKTTLTCHARIDNDSSAILTTSPTQAHNNIMPHTDTIKATQCNPAVNHLTSDAQPKQEDTKTLKCAVGNSSIHQRSRKQRHEHLLPVPMGEIEPVQLHSTEDTIDLNAERHDHNISTQIKRRGRPKKFNSSDSRRTDSRNNVEQSSTSPSINSVAEQASKSRRVQLLRKRLAIDMVTAEQPITLLNEPVERGLATEKYEERHNIAEGESETHRIEQRALRTPIRSSRRSNTPTQKCSLNIAVDSTMTLNNIIDQIPKNVVVTEGQRIHQAASDSSIMLKNFCSSTDTKLSSIYCTTSANTTTSNTSTEPTNTLNTAAASSMCMSAQIDLTMSSSSSSASNCSTTTATTTVAEVGTSLHFQNNTNTNNGGATGDNITGVNSSSLSSSTNNSMLPPTTILSSSNPLPDVIFKPNDFSSIIESQQLRSPLLPSPNEIPKDVKINIEGQTRGILRDLGDIKTPTSREDSDKYLSMPVRGRTRGRGRGTSRGGRGHKGHRLLQGTGAISVMNTTSIIRGNWSCSEYNQDLFSSSPQVFEEDTRMSADLSQNQSSLISHDLSTIRQQTEFLANEESQSSVISNNSAMDPNAGPSNTTSNTSSSTLAKKPKKKKMEICVAEDTEISVAGLAKYDWPPAKGCCPSKHRENFMIQEQVALYLGIKSFKRKYPDLARRQIDIEERNWLQEKGLVSEKMCDLGITAVLASDILDIMVTDFYNKYEEYMDYERQKHFREKDAKNKALGLHGPTKGLQAKDRAMLSASKWNSHLNKTRREERPTYLDLQTFIINKPVPLNAPVATSTNRPLVEATTIKTIQLPQPPVSLQVHPTELIKSRDSYYPLALVPGQFCEKYITYSAQELKQLPLKTVLDHAAEWWPKSFNGRHESTDTDSAAETAIDATTSQDRNKSYMERIRRRRTRRARTKYCHKIIDLNNKNNNNLKLPALLGDKIKSGTNNSVESPSIYDNSVTDSDDSTASSSLSSSSPPTTTESSDDEERNDVPKNNCGVCQRAQNCNLKDTPELFIQCYTCRQKVHPSCVEMPYRMTLRVRNYNWQCADCKCCIKCKRRRDQNKMLFCEQCDRGYHIYCLNIKAVPDCRWSCERCSICMRCGSTKPEGLAIVQQNVEQISPRNEKQLKQIKHKKVKWINEYRIDHITKLREHYSMLCVPCGRMKSLKRVQTINSTTNCSASNSTVNTTPLNQNSGISNTHNSVPSYSYNNIDNNSNSNVNPARHNATAAIYSTTVNTAPFHLTNNTIANCLTNATANVNSNSSLNAIAITSKSTSATIPSSEMDLDSSNKIGQSINTCSTVKRAIPIPTTNMAEVSAITTNIATTSTLSTKQDTNCGAPPVVA